MPADSLDLDAIQGRRLKAIQMVSDLCKIEGEPGFRRWVMSIPADVANDPDLVIAKSLGDCGALLARVAELETQDTTRLMEINSIADDRDRLRDILACERGEWAPEGWVWAGTFWTKNHDRLRVASIGAHKGGPDRRGYAHTASGNWCPERFTYALEAIEAADLAAKEKP